MAGESGEKEQGQPENSQTAPQEVETLRSLLAIEIVWKKTLDLVQWALDAGHIKPGTPEAERTAELLKQLRDGIAAIRAEADAQLQSGSDSSRVPREPLDLWVVFALTTFGRTSFDNSNVADWLRNAAFSEEAPIILLALANALAHPGAAWRLKLVGSKRGPRRTLSEEWKADERALEIAREVWEAREKDRGRMKRAKAIVAERHGISVETLRQNLHRAAKATVRRHQSLGVVDAFLAGRRHVTRERAAARLKKASDFEKWLCDFLDDAD